MRLEDSTARSYSGLGVEVARVFAPFGVNFILFIELNERCGLVRLEYQQKEISMDNC